MKFGRLAGLAALLLCLLVAGYTLRAQDRDRERTIERFNQSINLETAGKFAESLAELEDLSADARADYLVQLRLGWLHYQLGHNDRAETFYRQALATSADKSIEAMLGLTLPLAASEQWNEVEGLYRKILKLDPGHYTANLRLGQILSNRGDGTEAERFLSTALSHYPGDYEINLAAAWNNYSLGRRADARRLFERVLMMSPGDTSAQRGLALVK